MPKVRKKLTRREKLNSGYNPPLISAYQMKKQGVATLPPGQYTAIVEEVVMHHGIPHMRLGQVRSDG